MVASAKYAKTGNGSIMLLNAANVSPSPPQRKLIHHLRSGTVPLSIIRGRRKSSRLPTELEWSSRMGSFKSVLMEYGRTGRPHHPRYVERNSNFLGFRSIPRYRISRQSYSKPMTLLLFGGPSPSLANRFGLRRSTFVRDHPRSTRSTRSID